jgi:hypothetical protein
VLQLIGQTISHYRIVEKLGGGAREREWEDGNLAMHRVLD